MTTKQYKNEEKKNETKRKTKNEKESEFQINGKTGFKWICNCYLKEKMTIVD